MRWRSSLAVRAAIVCSAVAIGACSRTPPKPPPLVPQTSGELSLDGLSEPVTVIWDRWGIPHIEARTDHDLFFAQGFVQAQDRGFQMDLWRRSVQGRLSEVLGSNFIERDAMTRRMQYRGSLDAEWAAYGGGARGIAKAFTDGINAWVRLARERPPEEFVLAGWLPELWQPEDLLNRTDAFVASANAQEEILRAQLIAAVGTSASDGLLPPSGDGKTSVPPGLDLRIVSPGAAAALRRVGTAPFFLSLASSLPAGGGSNAWAVSSTRSASGRPILATDPHRPLVNPALRYLVHLKAPGWHAIGATAPWLPGVVIGHNDRVAWSMTALSADTQDIYIEQVNPQNPRQVRQGSRWIDMTSYSESIAYKGAEKPFEYEHLHTPRGAVIAVDGERNLAYVVRWSGREPGAAAELGALALMRVASSSEFRSSLEYWRMPTAEFVYADINGHLGKQVAGLVPRRTGWRGDLPVPASSNAYIWRGWLTPDDLPHSGDTTTDVLVSANDSRVRLERITHMLQEGKPASIEDMTAMQQDVQSSDAALIVPLLAPLQSASPDVETARRRLLSWSRRMEKDSVEARLFAAWRNNLLRRLIPATVPTHLGTELMARAEPLLAAALTKPSSPWFQKDMNRERDALLLSALDDASREIAADSVSGPVAWGDINRVLFAHPLGVTPAARVRYDVGPYQAGGDAQTVLSIAGPAPERMVGPSFRAIMEVGDWDRSIATLAPGQSGSPESPHFRDLTALWDRGEYFPLLFSSEAVKAQAASTLMLVPKGSAPASK